MGSEQSSQQQPQEGQQSLLGRKRDALKKQQSSPSQGRSSHNTGRSSPHPSISSDHDIPYVSYTVNKPIGDSPKHQSKNTTTIKPFLARHQARPVVTKGRNIVVVAQKSSNSVDQDSELEQLQSIPVFLPIIRGTLTSTSTKDPEILSRLNIPAFQKLTSLYQEHLRQNADQISSEQNVMAGKIRELDAQMSSIMQNLTERQKLYARYAERLARVHEVSHTLIRCQAALNATVANAEALNSLLPEEDRLETFVWTTG